ncbi:hypothetical protein GWI33_017586 [Rhynchophorus ferrugineus]|uniref:PH domain-containing protein n=1 Tax=Rhynchophorus ferrugineus TaxID=354439 RepID=A0A834M3K8_RHYFE|nr:hypothetical protein GWI33_017586 [Rhynchophorus ferrugineus]
MNIVEESMFCQDGGSSRASSTYDRNEFIDMLLEDTSERLSMQGTVTVNDGPLQMSSMSGDNSIYQGITIETINKAFEMKKEVFVQGNIAKQLIKLLKYGQNKIPNFIGSFEHREAERMYVLTDTKTQSLKDVFYSGTSTTHIHNQVTAQITIQNLKCFINRHDSIICDSTAYYTLVLRYHDIVYITKMCTPDRCGYISFDGSYIFNKIPYNFKIKVELYVLRIAPSPKGLRSLFSSRTHNIPLTKLIGETTIDLRNLHNDRFILKQLDQLKSRSDELTASVTVETQWPETWKGFLTIGIGDSNRHVIWDRKWCVLRGCEISCYTFPCEEKYAKSRMVISLRECVSCTEMRNIYPKKHSLLLEMKSVNVTERIYVTPDTQEELNSWKKNIDMILQGLINWRTVILS